MLTEPGLQTVCEMGISVSCEAFNAICNSFLWESPEISVNMARVSIQICLYFGSFVYSKLYSLVSFRLHASVGHCMNKNRGFG